jgi:hypothetical protein
MNSHYDLAKTEIATRVRAAEQRRAATMLWSSRGNRSGWARTQFRATGERH